MPAVFDGSDGLVHLPEGVDALPDLTEAGSLPASWRERAGRDPDRPCLHDRAEGWITRGDLAQRSAVAAGRLYGTGLRKGDRVLTSAPTSIALAVVHVACLRLGLVAVPVNGAYRKPELEHVLADADPRAVVFDDPEWRGWVSASAPGVQRLTTTLDLPDGEAPSLDLVELGDPAMLGYTSGTTGRSKAAVLTHGNLLAGAEALRLAWRWAPDDRLVLPLPLFHMHGLGVGLHGTLHAGGSAVLHERFDAGRVLEAVDAHEATLLFGVPTMYARLADADGAERLGRLRLCVAGSAPMSVELHERVRAVTGETVLERYGMTETLMLTSNPYDGPRRPGTVGLPLPGVELRLDDDGEVQVRGPNVFARYWRQPEATQAAFDDGWFRTGDVGELDDDGYLRLVGRTGDLIITGGYNVYPREVEDAVAELPAIAEAAVAGRPSEEWGEEVTAYVVLDAGTDPAEVAVEHVRARLADRLAAYKLPRRVEVVDRLPRNAMGKVERHRLGEGSTEARSVS